jgi:thymidine phosphorylase
MVRPGAQVASGDALLELHHRGGRGLETALALCQRAAAIGDEPPLRRQTVLDEVR